MKQLISQLISGSGHDPTLSDFGRVAIREYHFEKYTSTANAGSPLFQRMTAADRDR
jgi:hypothetical protein